MAKTLSDHLEDVRRERDARIEREIADEANQRMLADQEAERKAAIAAEVGLPPDAAPAEITRLHKLREDQFWSDFYNRNTATAHKRFSEIAAKVGLDPATAERTDVWQAMRRQGHPDTKRPIVHAAA
jgi:hypothetical protein